jgi:putative ABC transport system ATP-binding protein
VMQVIELKAVRKAYTLGDRDVEILHGVDLAITHGEYVALMGPSGSGKTSCLEIMGALSRPTSGSVLLDGRAIEHHGDDELADLRAREIGFVFQTFNLVPRWNIVRNAALPLLYAGVDREERTRRAEAQLVRLGLSHRLDHLPSQLSGGERQRVAIARALVNEPRILLADEPTGNLDEAAGRDLLEVFARLHEEGSTIVVVTHSEEVAAHAQRVIRVRDGMLESDVPVA